MEYDAVIFDLDGTLLESTASHLEWLYTAVEKSLKESGQKIETWKLSHNELEKLAGIRGYQKFEEKCNSLDIEPEDFWFKVSHHRAAGKLQLLDQDLLELVDRTQETMDFLRSEKASLAVVSNAPDPTVDDVIRFFDLAKKLDFFRGVTDLEDLKDRKPHSFHLKMAITELDAEKVLYVGDSSIDVLAAEKAGVDSAIIGEDEEATFELDELSDLRKVFSGTLEQD